MNDGLLPRPTDSAFNRKQAIYMAVSSAEVTAFQMSKRLAYALT
jgi:hypothetical protein